MEQTATSAYKDPAKWQFTYIVRHDNQFDHTSSWAFNDWGEAAKLRDALNAHDKGDKIAGQWHVEEEPIYPTAAEALAELTEEGYFDDE